MKRLVLAFLCLYGVVAFATVNFPYPQAHRYSNNTIIANNWNCAGQTASSMLKIKFTEYLNTFYEESGDQARIKFDDKQYTVSEGIGYGMIMMVYFSDNTTSYQSHFDKLWKYYQNHTNGNGVMNWKIQGFNGAVGQNGATDADEDVAFALAMAYYQFGDEKYKNAASSLIGKIRSSEFSSNGMHKLGDAWDPYKNPSYVSPAAYEVFKIFDASNANFWSQAISTNYTFLQKNQNSSTGIPSGWADNNSAAPVVGNNGYGFAGYDYDATRAPWRWAWSYAWYGHSQAQSLSSKLAAWVAPKLSTQLLINIKPDGTTDANVCKSNGCSFNGSSIGSLSSVLITNASYQEKLNDNFLSLMSQEPGYYHSSLRLLTGLLMSGNMQNFSNNYTNQPYVFTMTEEMEESCKTPEKDYYVNSGAFGWNSTTAILSEESIDGVHIGGTIRGTTREVSRELAEVSTGEKYVLSFSIKQSSYQPYIYYRVHLYESAESKETDYCAKNVKLVPDMEESYTCEFDAVSEAAPVLELSFNSSDEPQISVTNLSLKKASGEEVPLPSSLPYYSAKSSSFGMNIEGRNVGFYGLGNAATLHVMDMQGRLLKRSRVESGTTANLSDMRSGSYVLVLKNGNQVQKKKVLLK